MQLGPFTVPVVLIRFAAALTVGYVLQLAFMRRFKAAGRLFWDLLLDVVLIGFLLWKLAPLLQQPALLWTDPLAALYRPGGSLGLLLAGVGGTAYMVVQIVRRRPWPTGFPKLGAFTLAAVVAVFVLSGVVETVVPGGGVSRGGAGVTAAGEDSAGEVRQLVRDLGGPLEGQRNGSVRWDAEYLIVNFWASWCPPCRGEMPELIGFYTNLKTENVELIGLNMTSSEKSLTAVRKYVEESALPFPVLLDREGEIGRQLAIETLPTTIVLGPQGVLARRSGVVDRRWLRAQIPAK